MANWRDYSRPWVWRRRRSGTWRPVAYILHKTYNASENIFEQVSRTGENHVTDPEAERVEICHSEQARQLLGAGAFLDGEIVLPGFRYPTSDLFEELE